MFTCVRAWTSCPVRRARAEVVLPGTVGPTAGPEVLRQIRGVFLGTKGTPKCEQNKAKYRNLPHSTEPYRQIYGCFSSPMYAETGERWGCWRGPGWAGKGGLPGCTVLNSYPLLRIRIFAQITVTSDVIMRQGV